MGYCHSWKHKKAIPVNDWRDFTRFATSVFVSAALRGVPIAREYDRPYEPPEINKDEIIFNGIGDDGCETFVIERKPTPWAYPPGEELPAVTAIEKKEGVACWCKTNRYPYDLICVALLCYLSWHHADCFEISSNGGPDDWAGGFRLAQILDPSPGGLVPAEVFA